MSQKDILKELTIEDLSEHHRAIAEKVGLSNLIAMSESFGGIQVYIPRTVELLRGLLYRKITEEFDGDNAQALALKYQVSESTVYRNVREKMAEIKRAPLDGQVSLFG